jgi:hypothetical protein
MEFSMSLPNSKQTKGPIIMSERIMQENQQILQLSEQELETVVGGVLYVSPKPRGRFSGLPLPRVGGGVAPATTSTAAIAGILAGLAI